MDMLSNQEVVAAVGQQAVVVVLGVAQQAKLELQALLDLQALVEMQWLWLF